MATRTYIGTVSTDLCDPLNYTELAAPGPSDDLELDTDGQTLFLVTMSANLSVRSISPTGFNPELNISGHTLTVGAGGLINTGSMLFTNGTMITSNSFDMLDGQHNGLQLILAASLSIISGGGNIDCESITCVAGGAYALVAVAMLTVTDITVEATASVDWHGTAVHCDTLTSAGNLNSTGSTWALVIASDAFVTAGTVTNSDASGSAPIYATGTTVDGGGNTNWNFPAVDDGDALNDGFFMYF